MPKNFIRVDRMTTTAVFSQELISLIAQLRSTLNQLAKVKGIMDQNQNGADFIDVETLFGLPLDKGSVVYGHVRDTHKAMTGVGTFADALTLIDRVG